MNKTGKYSLLVISAVVSILLIYGPSVFAAHPLITDDTGTAGKGRLQFELSGEFSRDRDTEDRVSVKETGSEVATVISYGVTENADFVFGLPYQWMRVKEDGDIISDVDGISDLSMELKWSFFEKDGFGLALKPGITLPTGDEEKGVGHGRTSWSLAFISTKELEPVALHLNLAYMHDSYKLDEDKRGNREDLWHISLASEAEVLTNLTAVANIGMERNTNKTSSAHPAFILGGLIYSLSGLLDIDMGIKAGLNKPETDYSILTGVVLKL